MTDQTAPRTMAEVQADIHGCIRRGEHEMEANYPYENPLNDLQRELIMAFEREHGQAWLGKINLYDEDKGQPIIWRYQGDLVRNFTARFVIDHFDLELHRLIIERSQAEYTGTRDDYKRVEQITARIHELGGEMLIWN